MVAVQIGSVAPADAEVAHAGPAFDEQFCDFSSLSVLLLPLRASFEVGFLV